MDHYAANAVLIVFDDYKEKDFTGRIYTRYEPERIAFLSSIELVRTLDALYDRWNLPANTVVYRDFEKIGKSGRKTVIRKRRESTRDMPVSRALPQEKGKLATVILECQQRLHADWKGRFWMDDEAESRHFSSTLELLMFLDWTISRRVKGKAFLWH